MLQKYMVKDCLNIPKKGDQRSPFFGMCEKVVVVYFTATFWPLIT